MLNIQDHWRKLIGDPNQFQLETRVFHAICIALIFGVSVNIPVAFYMQITPLIILLSVVVVFAGILFFLSRIKKRHHIAANLFQVFVNIALIVNYYYNSGVNGPSYTIFLLAFLVTVATSPTRHYYLWLPLNIALIVGLLIAEYFFPSFTQQTYVNRQSRFIDMICSYIVIAGFAFLVIAYIRKAYNNQQAQVVVKTKALNNANETKQKLLSVLGHDLKEPLAALQRHLQLMAVEELEESGRKAVKARLQNMTQNASVMLLTILSWTKGQMEHIEPFMQNLRVADVLATVISMASDIGKSKKIGVWTDVPIDVTVKADSQMLELIVQNLLINAIKFTREGGNVWLSARISQGECIIRVRDDGIGIPEDIQAQIFSLGIESRTGTTFEKGMGLGLVLCRKLTELQEGTITFRTDINEGTTFYLKLSKGDIS